MKRADSDKMRIMKRARQRFAREMYHYTRVNIYILYQVSIIQSRRKAFADNCDEMEMYDAHCFDDANIAWKRAWFEY